VPTELGLDGTDNIALLCIESRVLELSDHFAPSEPAQITALLPRWALGLQLSQLREIITLFKLRQYLLRILL
jgi:hypothetical protein